MFPPVRHTLEKSYDYVSEYSSFEYWRDSIPDVPIDDDLLANVVVIPNQENGNKKEDNKNETEALKQ